MHACTGQAKKGVAWSGSSGWAGGLWGLAYACQPQTAHRRRDTDTKENSLSWSRKQKWHEAATKQASLNLHQNKHESWHGVTYTIAAVKTVEQYLFDSKRPYQGGFFSTTGDLRPPRGLLGSRLKLSSDPIIQLAEVVARLEGDDGWNTCGGCAWCGAHRSPRPDRPALLQLTLTSRHRRNSVVRLFSWTPPDKKQDWGVSQDCSSQIHDIHNPETFHLPS